LDDDDGGFTFVSTSVDNLAYKSEELAKEHGYPERVIDFNVRSFTQSKYK